MSERKAREFYVVQNRYEPHCEPMQVSDSPFARSPKFQAEYEQIHVREVLPDDELEKLRAENERLRLSMTTGDRNWASLLNERDKLREAAAMLRGAVEQYSDKHCRCCRRGEFESVRDTDLSLALARFDEMMKGSKE